MKEHRYPAWGKFLKSERERVFRSARDFCARARLEISYPQYSRYEAGDQLPSLEQALELAKALRVPILNMLLEWNRAQVKDPDALEELQKLAGASQTQAPDTTSPPARVPLDDVIVFNRSHLELFGSDPLYRDIFTYINSFAPECIRTKEISTALKLSPARAEEMLEKLRGLGVVERSGSDYRAAKRNFYFPDDEDFFAMRNLNLTHNASAILRSLNYPDLAARKAYRGLVTRELSAEQLSIVIGQLEAVMSRVVELPETSRPEKIYSVCALLGSRFSRAPN